MRGERVRRLLSLLWIVWCAPEAGAALPCAADDTPPALADLAARLLKSRTPAAWTALQAEAEALADPTMQPVPSARACALYLAGGAAFFRSAAPGPTRTLRAAEAINHLLRAAVLDPTAFAERQPQARLGAAFKRLAADPDQAPPTTPTVAVRLPRPPVGSAPTEGWLRLSAPGAGLVVDLPAPPPDAATAKLWLRPGTWTVTWRAPCGEVTETSVVGDTLQLPRAPACPVTLAARGLDGALVPNVTVRTAEGIAVQGPLTSALGVVLVTAPGYQTWQGAPPAAGGPWDLQLTRCPVDLQVTTEPTDAQVEGGGPGPWGPRQIRVARPGYATVQTTLDLPAPLECDAPGADGPATLRHEQHVQLLRLIEFSLTDARGASVVPAEIVIDGQPPIAGDATGLAHLPGTLRWQLRHPTVGAVAGEATVTPCTAPSCPAQIIEAEALALTLPRERPLAPVLTLGLGGLSVAAGLVAGVGALNTEGDLDAYTTRRAEGVSVDTLARRRDNQAFTADVLLGTGAVLLVGGLVWYLLTDHR